MIKTMKWLAGALLAVSIAACGGGGGSPGGTGTGGTGGTGGNAGTPTVTVSLVDAAGAPTTSVTTGSTVSAKATVKDGAGAPLSGAVVTFSGDSNARVTMIPSNGTALTDSAGVATVQLAPESSSSSGAGVLTASVTVGSTTAKGTTSYQIPNAVADFVMLLDKSTLHNSGETATLTLIAVDKANNVVRNAKVSVSSDANTVFTPGSTVTDDNGKFTGTLSVGADKSDRQVTLTSTVSGITKKTTVLVTGSTIAVTTTPSALAPAGAATLTARLTDSAGNVIPNTTLTLTGDIAGLNGKTAVTDANGKATVDFTAPSVAGSYLVNVAGSGVTKSLSLQVGTTIPSAVIPSGVVPSLSALPNVVAPNTAGSTTNQSQLRFLMIDANNQPVPNVRVRFQITSTGQGSFDSTIDSGSSAVYTNAAGVATASFTPGSTISPTDGVNVQACWQATDFSSPTQCTNSVSVKLTVASQALAISIGDDNLLAKGTGTYIKKFTITVADSAGRPVPNAPVDIFLDLPYYGKGTFDQFDTFPLLVQPTINNQNIPGSATTRSSCVNQDTNRNGVKDPGEMTTNTDGFGQPVLLPRKADMLISYADPAVKTTNASGILIVQVEYSQRFATWLEYHIRASTSVAGSQGTAERAFFTQFVKGDETNGGSFLTPPYGVGACDQAN